ncbi:sensor histidine kinase [Solirubrobacter soli]|uniref:sensor histidine kinase n=1 Tax=Solirubrobacter soli TaxID=363832 RepID=UPI00146E3C5C|nr:histidine kinase [Solirubrobacter soli]
MVPAAAVLALAAVPSPAVTPLIVAAAACVALILRGHDPDDDAVGDAAPVSEIPGEPDRVLFDAAEAVGRSLGLAYVGIDLADSHYEWGRTTDATTAVRLTYGDRPLGRLRAAGRGGCALTGRERRGLEVQARQVALIAHSVGLSKHALRSRERIVAEREEERRHLRHDLHDCLGPSLAAMTLTLDAARNLLDRDPPAVDGLLAGMREQSQHAIADIRRLAAGLRPPTLDQLGLLGAIRDCVEQRVSRSDLQVSVEAPDALPALPAAVEVAALRIVQEAIGGLRRQGAVRLSVEDALEVAVEGDGLALGGIGTCAREVGGTCVLEPLPGGVRISARLPLALGG